MTTEPCKRCHRDAKLKDLCAAHYYGIYDRNKLRSHLEMLEYEKDFIEVLMEDFDHTPTRRLV